MKLYSKRQKGAPSKYLELEAKMNSLKDAYVRAKVRFEFRKKYKLHEESNEMEKTQKEYLEAVDVFKKYDAAIPCLD